MCWHTIDNLIVYIRYRYTQFTQFHIEDMFLSVYAMLTHFSAFQRCIGTFSTLNVVLWRP
ncbi:hypothetical protein PAXRUDRAFT_171819 [Paxillus rubicundulus Ve08.2h10]|uniref:Uncharacterized protein n=1 Tax=Paxillus rubicundulus Ve08.2h10 TaxID=930991 RepID=A0A0D0BWT5_9AGAM|nr:hypothetical protein PAXRUDRAFT_171819 [Paxillus rubicundulus Ve08.2h10]